MALTNFLKDIADAIRYAEQSEGQINAQQFATRIRALSGGQPIPPEPPTPPEPKDLIFWSALAQADIEPNTKLTVSNNKLTVGRYTSSDTNYYGKVSGTKVDGYIPLTQGTKVRLQHTGRDSGHTFVMTDDDMNVLYTSGANTRVDTLTEVDVPNGATRLYYCEYLNQTFIIETQIEDDGRLDEPTQDMLDANYELSVAEQGEKGIYNNLKACFTFVLDDSIPSIDQTYAIFKANGIKTCSASIPRNYRSVTLNGDKCVIDIVREMVADGGEVLSHNGGALTSETQATDSFKYNAITKQLLKDYGFNPTTIILAGGEGQDTIDFLQAEKWSRMYYKMSDKYGLVEPYKHDRVAFANFNSLNNFKTSVNDAIANNKWVVYYMHGINKETQVATYLNDALAYVKDKLDEGACEIKTYSEVYDAYYRNDPHLMGTGIIGSGKEEMAWTFDDGLLTITNNYKYGGVNTVSVTASEYHANDTTKIVFNQTNTTVSIGFGSGFLSDFVNCTEVVILGLNGMRGGTNSLPPNATTIKVSWSESTQRINPETWGANPNATVIYDYTE